MDVFYVARITIITNSRRRNNMIEEEGGKSDCISISRESMTSAEQAATTMMLQIYVNTENLILTDESHIPSSNPRKHCSSSTFGSVGIKIREQSI